MTYSNQLHMDGEHHHVGTKLVASWMHHVPEYSRVSRQTNKAYPLVVWEALSVDLTERQFPSMAFLSFIGSGDELSPHRAAGSPTARHYHPDDTLRIVGLSSFLPSRPTQGPKTGLRDCWVMPVVSLLLQCSCPLLTWFAQINVRMVRGIAGGLLWGNIHDFGWSRRQPLDHSRSGMPCQFSGGLILLEPRQNLEPLHRTRLRCCADFSRKTKEHACIWIWSMMLHRCFSGPSVSSQVPEQSLSSHFCTVWYLQLSLQRISNVHSSSLVLHTCW